MLADPTNKNNQNVPEDGECGEPPSNKREMGALCSRTGTETRLGEGEGKTLLKHEGKEELKNEEKAEDLFSEEEMEALLNDEGMEDWPDGEKTGELQNEEETEDLLSEEEMEALLNDEGGEDWPNGGEIEELPGAEGGADLLAGEKGAEAGGEDDDEVQIDWNKPRAQIASTLSRFRMRSPEDVDDLLQETALRYHRILKTAKKDNPAALRNPIAYVRRIADNVCKDFLRKEIPRLRNTMSDPSPPSTDDDGNISYIDDFLPNRDPSLEEIIVCQDRWERFCQRIKHPQLRAELRLFIGGESYQEIAAKVKRAPSTVRSDIQKMKRQLKMLCQDGEE